MYVRSSPFARDSQAGSSLVKGRLQAVEHPVAARLIIQTKQHLVHGGQNHAENRRRDRVSGDIFVECCSVDLVLSRTLRWRVPAPAV